MRRAAASRAAWWALPLFGLVASYLPDLGQGFIKDDFRWILESRTEGPFGWLDLFGRDNGFYRPLVSASFALNEALFGLDAWGYGATNLLLVLGCTWALFSVGRGMGMPHGAALLAASIWALNPHGIGGAILWISGRTSLLATLFALLAARFALRGPPWAASLLVLAALLSKEEVILLPAILVLWVAAVPGDEGLAWDFRRAGRTAAACVPAVAVYFLLRAHTDAFVPASAPPHYRLTFDPALLARNVLEYTDRTGTLAAAAVLLAMALAWQRPRLDARERRWALLGAIWMACGLVLPIFLPVRSSLYAIFPSVGSALIAAALIHAAWRQAAATRRRLVLVAAVIAVAVLVPLHRSRNVRLVKTAQLSSQVLDDLGAAFALAPPGTVLVIHDAVGARYNIENAFGTLIGDAMTLRTGRPGSPLWLEPPLADWKAAGLQRPEGRPTSHLWLRDGRLVGPPR